MKQQLLQVPFARNSEFIYLVSPAPGVAAINCIHCQLLVQQSTMLAFLALEAKRPTNAFRETSACTL